MHHTIVLRALLYTVNVFRNTLNAHQVEYHINAKISFIHIQISIFTYCDSLGSHQALNHHQFVDGS